LFSLLLAVMVMSALLVSDRERFWVLYLYNF
jgi:hypothetical protein